MKLLHRPSVVHRALVAGSIIAMSISMSWASSQGSASALTAKVDEPSLSHFPKPVAAPAEAPNILIIMTDDVGFAASTTFGGAIPTPTFDELAIRGLRFNNFHTKALCSPTRASLLTGRNHHAVGFGNVSDMARGLPGYNSVIPRSAGTIGQILRANGYDTAMIGKNHNVPSWQSGPLGPFDQWGSGLGFDYFYGFHGGMTDQFAPALIENEKMIEPPARPDYILDRDLADHAVDWLRMQKTQGDGRPFLMYYAPGTAHAPLHAPGEWLAKFRGMFDAGWDVYRQQSFERQKRMGVIPANARLAPLSPGIKPWVELHADEKKVAARLMEAYAAALAFADDQMGRLIDELRRSGQLDNTLVIYIQGDNGASAEGGQLGSMNYAGRTSPNRELSYALSHLDEIGGPRSYPVMAAGWAQAINAPFPHYKVTASRLGGTRNGMVVSWPDRIRKPGLRQQFTDVTDILPTILEATGIAAPQSVNGVAQTAFDGSSFADLFGRADAPSRHRTQYFEILGNAAIYNDGWIAGTQVASSGAAGEVLPAKDAPWQLYDLFSDFSQTRDLAEERPDKLKEMQNLFETEARRNKVLPLSSDPLSALLPQSRPDHFAQAGRFTFSPSDYRFSEGSFPSINNRSWSIEAAIDQSDSANSGMIVTQGGRFSGWGLAIFAGKPTFIYRATDHDDDMIQLESPEVLTSGSHRVTVKFAMYESSSSAANFRGTKLAAAGLGLGGNLTMMIDGRKVAETGVTRTVIAKFAPEDASVGRDTGTSLNDRYSVPFRYEGKLNSVSITLEPAPSRK